MSDVNQVKHMLSNEESQKNYMLIRLGKQHKKINM